MYLLMDESGCLCFDFNKKKTSKYFVVCCLFASSKRPLEKIVKKVHGGLRQQLHKHLGVLHLRLKHPLMKKACKLLIL